MALPETQRHKWAQLFRDARFILDTMRHQTSNAPRPNEFGRSTQASMWNMPPGELVRKFDAESPSLDPEDVPSSVELRWRPGEHQAALT